MSTFPAASILPAGLGLAAAVFRLAKMRVLPGLRLRSWRLLPQSAAWVSGVCAAAGVWVVAFGLIGSAAHAAVPFTHATLVAAGAAHSCALTSGGGVKCWGYNNSGQLGDATTVNRLTAVEVAGLGSGVSKVVTGGFHSCALTTAGGVKCWGDNSFGALGNNSVTASATPVDVSGLGSGVSAIAAGAAHTCALTSSGAVKCWGLNLTGQIGDNSTTNRLTPVDVSGLGSGISALAAGGEHSCALTSSGGVKCWGYNFHGQLGDASTTNRSTPVDVSGLGSGISAIAAGGSHTCAQTSSNGLQCWGSNASGQLGNNSTSSSSTPVSASGLASGVSAVVTGGDFTCVLTSAGGVKCFGINSQGQLGDHSTTGRLTASDVSGLTSGVSALAAGSTHSCALTSSGAVKCWGGNTYGALGDNVVTTRFTPVDSTLTSGVSTVSAGFDHSCALVSGGVQCWGNSDVGQVGDGGITIRLTPVAVSGLGSGVSAVSVRGRMSCALTSSGGVKCWGANENGQLGDNSTTDRLTPVDVSGLGSGVSAVSAGGYSACALTSGGGVKCWGDNSAGQLGDNSTTHRLTPVDVSGLGSGVSAISANVDHSCALTSGGGVKCWGNNAYGQLGDGTTTDRLTAVDVGGLGSGVSAISSGAYFTCALTSAGGVKCWGTNNYGQLGDSSVVNASATPVDVAGLTSGVSAIATGYAHACALTSSGGVKCWGMNQIGQLGNNSNSYDDTPNPVNVSGLSSGVSAIALGNDYSCALTTAGGIKCWGDNTFAQFGDGTIEYARLFADDALHTPGAPGAPGIGLATAGNGQVTVTFTAPASDGGSAITGYTVTSSPSGGTDSHAGSTSLSHVITGLSNGTAYTFSVSASNSNGTSAASTASNSVTPTGDGQTITFSGPVAQTLGGGSVTLSATSTSGLTVVFSSSTPTVCSVSGTSLTLLAAGTCTVSANQQGNASFAAATPVSQSFSVAKASQTITFSGPAAQTLGGSSVTLSATASSGLSVVFSASTPSVCSVSGNSVSLLAAGTCTLAADQAGNATFSAASPISQSFTINPAPTPVEVPTPTPIPISTPTPTPTIVVNPTEGSFNLGDNGIGSLTGVGTVTLGSGSTLTISAGTGALGSILNLPANNGNGAGTSLIVAGQSLIITNGATGSQLTLAAGTITGQSLALPQLQSGSISLSAPANAPVLVVGGSSGNAGTVIASGSSGATFDAALQADGSTVLVLTSGSVTLTFSNNTANSAANSFAANETSLILMGGEFLQLDSKGRPSAIRVGSNSGQGAGDALPMATLPKGMKQDGALGNLKGPLVRLGGKTIREVVQQDLQKALGQSLSLDQDTLAGATVFSFKGGKLPVAVQHPILVDSAQADGLTLLDNGKAQLVSRGMVSTLIPNVVNLGALGLSLLALDPAAQTTLTADGHLRITALSQRVAVRPAWFALSGGKNPGFSINAGGYVVYTSANGEQQKLYPVFADFARLVQVLTRYDAKTRPATQLDSTVSATLLGRQYVLTPDYHLRDTPARHAADDWWSDNGHLYLNYGNGVSQGFTAR